MQSTYEKGGVLKTKMVRKMFEITPIKPLYFCSLYYFLL